MGERAKALAERFEKANDDVIKAVEHSSDADWRANCADLGWSVGVTAHHIAMGHRGIGGLVQALANGRAPGLTPEQIDQGNAEHARQFANCTKQETLDLLRANGKSAADGVRGLSDEQLNRKAAVLAGAPELTVEQVVENVLIGHPQGHLQNMRAAQPSG